MDTATTTRLAADFDTDTATARRLEARRLQLLRFASVIDAAPDGDGRYWTAMPALDRAWGRYGLACWREAFRQLDRDGIAHLTDPEWEFERYGIPADDKARTAGQLVADIARGIAAAD